MKFGLRETEFEFLKSALIDPLKSFGAKVYVFGSRARGSQRKFSDVDLLYCESDDHPIKPHEIHKILSKVEESDFPYHVDLVNFKELASSYKDNVLRDRVEL